MKLPNNIEDILFSKEKKYLNFTGNIEDALHFGFSFIETEDHFVDSVIANSKIIKMIFTEMDDSEIDSDKGIGKLWTANLYVSNKLKNNQLIFSNSSGSVILNLNINVNGGKSYADL